MSEIIFKKVQEEIAAAIGVSPEEIKLESTFEELGMDSLDALSVVNNLEEIFEVAIPNEEVLNIQTVKQAVDSLRKVVDLKN